MSETLHDHVLVAARRACASLVRSVGPEATESAGNENAAESESTLKPVVDLFLSALGREPLDPSKIAVLVAATSDVPLREVFDLLRCAERCVESELSLDPEVGLASVRWREVCDMLRNASFDLLSGYCERRAPLPDGVDPATLLVSRPVFELAMENELHRALRHHRPLSLILFEVDDLAGLRAAHGEGVGDRLLERLSIFVRQYFRQQDWVARFGAAQVAVLLPETRATDAEALAARASAAIRDRMAFSDREDRQARITVSGCVLNVTLGGARAEGVSKVTAARVIEEAENTVRRVRAKGGNAIEQVEIARASVSLAEAAAVLKSDCDAVQRLIASRTLPAVDSDGETRVDRAALEAYARRMQK